MALSAKSLILPTRLTIMEVQRGLSKASLLKNGRRMAPYCGSAEIVRSTPLFLLPFITPISQRAAEKPFFGT